MATSNGLMITSSPSSVEETIRRLQATFAAKDLQIFAVIDHSGEAAKVGLIMPPTKVIIVGSPKAGTPLMLAAPSLAIDLPLKVLIAEDANGKVSVTYNAPEYLRERHGVPPDLIKNLSAAAALIANAVK